MPSKATPDPFRVLKAFRNALHVLAISSNTVDVAPVIRLTISKEPEACHYRILLRSAVSALTDRRVPAFPTFLHVIFFSIFLCSYSSVFLHSNRACPHVSCASFVAVELSEAFRFSMSCPHRFYLSKVLMSVHDLGDWGCVIELHDGCLMKDWTKVGVSSSSLRMLVSVSAQRRRGVKTFVHKLVLTAK